MTPNIDPKLARIAALEADMAYHHGADWEAQLADGNIAIMPATQAYADVGSRAACHHRIALTCRDVTGRISGILNFMTLSYRHFAIDVDDGTSFRE